ncbi:hypothetical protein V5F44_04120 [Xanthobacter sp. V2C-8]
MSETPEAEWASDTRTPEVAARFSGFCMTLTRVSPMAVASLP